MLISIEEARGIIESGKWLHVCGSGDLLKQLPKGNWIGGSNIYFMDSDGGEVSEEKLSVMEMPFKNCKIMAYTEKTIENITSDAYSNGFTLLIIPFGSPVRDFYSLKASEFKDMFIHNIVGWVSGTNLDKEGQKALVANGQTGEYFESEAVALHVALDDNQIANIGIINIFSPNIDGAVVEFFEDSAVVEKCLINGEETVLTEYLEKNNINTKVPLVGEYFGADVNVTFFSIDKGVVTFGAPCFKGIKYRFGKPVDDYPKAFMEALKELKGVEPVFSCNCVSNFMFGELEGKKIDGFFGPMSFGEIAYQLLNQTLVYLLISSNN